MQLSTSFDSSPYFMRCYNDLCLKHKSEGCRNAVLIGLRQVSDVAVGTFHICGGYVLGEIILSRSSIVGDIYFIYVQDSKRGNGYGRKLYLLFEIVVRERSVSVGMKVAVIRISIKQCIINSISFWKRLGFIGSANSVCLTKVINLN